MITPENVFPPEFEARLDYYRTRYWFRYQDRIDEYNDLYDPDQAKTQEWYSEFYASFGDDFAAQISDDPISQFLSTAPPVSTGKAA